jgi:hypothetical protein
LCISSDYWDSLFSLTWGLSIRCKRESEKEDPFRLII